MKIRILRADKRHLGDINRLIKDANIGSDIKKLPSRAWVVKIGQKIIACACLDFVGNKAAVFTHLVVNKEFRRRGIGSALIELRRKSALKKGIKTLSLITMYYHFNFYKRRGFKVIKRAELPDHLRNYWMFTAKRYKKCAVLINKT